MKALSLQAQQRVALLDLPVPLIGPDDVLVRVHASGLCATDVKAYQRGHPHIKPGHILGHEIAGEIVEVGKHVRGWQLGDHVGAPPYVPCGHCHACQRGAYTQCPALFTSAFDPGGFAEYLRIPEAIVQRGMIRLPASLGWVEASLLEPLACVVHGMKALDVRAGDSLLIVGDGPMGLMHGRVGRWLGARPIIQSGLIPHRLEMARRVADVVVDISKGDLAQVVRDATDGRGADKIAVCVAQPQVAQESLKLVADGGAINFFGGMPGGSTITVDMALLHYNEVSLLGSFGSAPPHYELALEMITDPSLNLGELVTSTIRIEEVEQALKAADQYKAIKTVVVFD